MLRTKRVLGVFSRRGQLALYHANIKAAKRRNRDSEFHVIDLRSDVLTQPTPEMKAIMNSAVLGDDVFGECSVSNALQEKVAKLFGKEAALFVPSGTMGNLLSVLTHCPGRGSEVLLGDKSHLFLWEQGGMSQFGGLHPNIIPNHRNGTFPVEEIDKRVRPTDDPHYAWTSLICVEDTHNYCGGSAVPIEWLRQVKEKADKHEVPVHMDGARLMNAAVAQNVSPREILQHVDSVSMCFSKGLGAPIGSIIAGKGEFITRARRLRKALGGGWRKPGQLAAAASDCLDQAQDTVSRDHKHAQIIAQALHEHGQGVVDIEPKDVHTNILVVRTKRNLTGEQFCKRFAQVPPEEEAHVKRSVIVRAIPLGPDLARLVLNWNITSEDVQAVEEKCLYVMNEWKSKMKSL